MPRSRAALFVSSHSGGTAGLHQIVEQRHSRQTGGQLFEYLDPLRAELGAQSRYPRNIAARPREARHDGCAGGAHCGHD